MWPAGLLAMSLVSKLRTCAVSGEARIEAAQGVGEVGWRDYLGQAGPGQGTATPCCDLTQSHNSLTSS